MSNCVQPAIGALRRYHMAYGNEGSRSISQASAKGRVKWFNPTKGYGFITLDNGGDAFCHASALQATGHADVPPGTTIVCDLADSQRGLQVVAVHSVDTSTAEAPSRTHPGTISRSLPPTCWTTIRAGSATVSQSTACSSTRRWAASA